MASDLACEGLPARVAPGEELTLSLRLENPYDYDIRVDGRPLSLVMLWKHGRFRVEEFPVEAAPFTLPARGHLTLEVPLRVPDELAGTDFDAGFALRREGYVNWFNGKPLRVEVAHL